MARKLKKLETTWSEYSQEVRKGLQLKIDLIDDVNQKLKGLGDSIDYTKTEELIEETLENIKNQLKTTKNNLIIAKARIVG